MHHPYLDLIFLPKRMKIEKAAEIAANLHNKNEYVMHIGIAKQTLNHELVLKKVHIVIKYYQKTWLKS